MPTFLARIPIPDGWQLVSSDVLAPLDPAKAHPSWATHWHRAEQRPVRARKFYGRWIYQLCPAQERM